MTFDWNISNQPAMSCGDKVRAVIRQTAEAEMSDSARDFPLAYEGISAKGKSFVDWFAVNVSPSGSGLDFANEFSSQQISLLQSAIFPGNAYSHQDLFDLLATAWFAFSSFTYVGPLFNNAACWSHFHQHVIAWLNHLVVPEIFQKNNNRVLRAIPKPPRYKPAEIFESLWVLESEATSKQGTAVALNSVGLITCAHVLENDTKAFGVANFDRRFEYQIKARNDDIDLAILEIFGQGTSGLTSGSADRLVLMDHLAIAGFPNYRKGDSGSFVPGLVVGFRVKSGIRRVLTNAPIVGGTSGGAVVDAENLLIGFAVTGADRMEKAYETEDHGIIPIEALKFLG